MEPLQRAGPADLDTLLPLIAEFYEVDGHAFDESVVRAALGPLLDGDTAGQVWLITTGNGDVVGYAVLTWGYSLESGGREGLVDELFLRRRNTGLGGRALEALVDRAGRAGCRVLFLETESRNARVRGFYARHNFLEQDSIWMSRALDGPADLLE
jgi:GNAT superfamily N-acetyltransferase